MKKKLLTYAYLLTLITITGCESTQYEVYENHEISACGVADPLNNLEWLKNFCNSNKEAYSINIYLVEDTLTHDTYFHVSYNYKKQTDYGNLFVYNCNGDEVFSWYMGTPPSPRYREFFLNKEYLGKVWSVTQILK